MSYQVYVTRDFPYSFHTADSISGARVVAPLVRGLGNASAIESGNTTTFEFPGFVQSRRNKAWALEAWFVPLSDSSHIIGHAEGDGILWENNSIIFRLKLSDEDVDVVYYPDQIKTFHVLAQYSRNSMTLYVNGEMVASKVLESIQEEKSLITFSNEGQLVSSGSHIIDAIGLYTTDVSGRLAKEHFEYGSKTDSMMVLTSSRGGALNEHANFQPTIYYKWSNDAWNWRDFGILGLDSQGLFAVEPGEWKDNIMIDDLVDSIYIDWKGHGDFDVEYAVDGTNWTPAQKLTVIEVASLEDLAVRINFNDEFARVQELSVVSAKDVYLNETPMERSVLVTFASSSEAFYPIENKQYGGARGEVIFNVSSVLPTAAVEFWARPDIATTVGTYTNFPGTAYVNGSLGTSLVPNEWNHVFINLTSPENVVRYINGNGRWACPTLYPNSLPASQILDLYNSYYGKDIVRIDFDGFMTIEDSTSVSYAYDWTVS